MRVTYRSRTETSFSIIVPVQLLKLFTRNVASEINTARETACDQETIKLLQNPYLLRSSCFIDGTWRDKKDAAAGHANRYQVYNPANGQPVHTVDRNTSLEAREAIEAASESLKTWKQTTAVSRAKILHKWRDLMTNNMPDIQTLMTLESGKPLTEAKGEIQAGLASLDWFAGEATRLSGQYLQPVGPSKRSITMLQPVGVVGAITPWNFPFSMITRKVAPALAAGCSVVLKPSEETPLTAFAIAQLAHEAGLPAGVFNVVSGHASDIGTELATNTAVRKLTFTGSTRVGKLLVKQAADTVKRVSMELGGNAPYIVFQDADIGKAADAAVASGLRNAGQTCICANRILVEEAVHEELQAALLQRMQALRIGNGFEDATQMGPCINSIRTSHAQELVDDAVSKGARVLCGGSPPSHLPHGHFFSPTLIADALPSMRVFAEETFAPVIPLFPFKTEEEAIKMANDTEYGLAAYFFTKDISRAFRVAEELEYGMVGVNEIALVSESAPFGGVKQSGLGREHGSSGIMEYVEEKHVCLGL